MCEPTKPFPPSTSNYLTKIKHDDVPIMQKQKLLKMGVLSTFSDGGGGTFTVSASSTFKGSSTLLLVVDKNLPFLDTDVVLFQNNDESQSTRRCQTYIF